MGRQRLRRGFSLVEVMTAALVLGLGVMAATRVYSAGEQGRADARWSFRARQAVEQRVETLSARGAERLPDCPGPSGCRNDRGELHPEKLTVDGYPCTQIVHTPSLTDRHRHEEGGRLRLDTSVWVHPNPVQRRQSRILTISACWHDGRGRVRTLSAQRLVLDEGSSP